MQLAGVADAGEYGPYLSFKLFVAVLLGGVASALGPSAGIAGLAVVTGAAGVLGSLEGVESARFDPMLAALLLLAVLALGGEGIVPLRAQARRAGGDAAGAAGAGARPRARRAAGEHRAADPRRRVADEALRLARRRGLGVARARSGRGVRAHRPERLRQDDRAPPPGGRLPPRRRTRARRRHGRRRRAAARACGARCRAHAADVCRVRRADRAREPARRDGHPAHPRRRVPDGVRDTARARRGRASARGCTFPARGRRPRLGSGRARGRARRPRAASRRGRGRARGRSASAPARRAFGRLVARRRPPPRRVALTPARAGDVDPARRAQPAARSLGRG